MTADVIEGVAYERTGRLGCPICGRDYPERIIPVAFGMTAAVAECEGCRLAYQTPQPSLEASLAYMNMRWRSHDSYVSDGEYQRARAQALVKLLEDLVESRPRLLDFGAGIGSFTRAARERGWDAVGIERSESALARAAENGIDLEPSFGTISGLFDIITLWDVIEHQRDPLGTIESLLPYLRPGGWMIFETGNWESWNRLAAGDAWGLYLFDHQYYFSPHSLEALVRRAGLTEFRLLPGSESPPPSPPGADSGADARARWDAYRRGSALWPAHAHIDIMVAAARSHGAE